MFVIVVPIRQSTIRRMSICQLTTVSPHFYVIKSTRQRLHQINRFLLNYCNECRLYYYNKYCTVMILLLYYCNESTVLRYDKINFIGRL